MMPIRAERPENGNTACLWSGPSRLDRSKTVALLLSGLSSGSTNGKTGAMLQAHIVQLDDHPSEDRSGICGGCPLLSRCYLEWSKAPAGVRRSLLAGRVGYLSPVLAGELAAARDCGVRLGASGDPAAIPVHVWRQLLAGGAWHTGYTHQWRRLSASVWGFLMASVETDAARDKAEAAGWSTFRVGDQDGDPGSGESWCPASAERDRAATCSECRRCDGASGSVFIREHGHGR